MIIVLTRAQIELVLSHFNPIHTISPVSVINVSLSISLVDLEQLEAKSVAHPVFYLYSTYQDLMSQS